MKSDRAEDREFRYGRGARWGLLFLLGGTVFFAAGALFVMYKLESFRASVEESLEARMGAQLVMGAVSVDGFRGLRIDGLRVAIAPADGPSLSLETPVAYVRINLNDLFYGRLTVDRIVLDGSSIRVEREEGTDWYSPSAFDPYTAFSLSATDTFRLTGTGCSLEIRNVVGDTKLRVEPFRFDVSRPVDASDLTASLEGDLAGDAEKHLDIRLTFASLEDFDLRVQASKITAEDANVFLPAAHRLLSSGTATPTLWLNGRPDRRLLFWLQTPFEDIVLQDQPEFLGPASGNLAFDATYSADDHLLTVIAARGESEQLSGTLDGSVSFTDAGPELDLRLTATRLPITQFLNHALDGQLSDYGAVELALGEPHELAVAIHGPADALVFEGRASARSGELRFSPADGDRPRVDLRLGKLEGRWDSSTGQVSGSFVLLDGGIGGDAESGPAETIVASTEDASPFTGHFAYDLATGDGEMSLNGMLAGIENTPFAGILPNTSIAGSVDLRCKGTKRENVYSVEADVDATLARVDYSWWFGKPLGMGANGKVRLSLVPYESATIEVEAEMASSHIDASMTLAYDRDRPRPWGVQEVRAASERLDVNAIGKCLRIPYRVTGGTATQADFFWKGEPGDDARWEQTLTCAIDEAMLLPEDENADTPMEFREIELEVSVREELASVGELTLRVGSASMPPFGSTWFLPLRPAGEDGAAAALDQRTWSYDLSAGELELPPWKGRNFTGKAYTNAVTTGFNEYRVEVGDGYIEGNYHLTRAERAYITDIAWERVPATYFIQHLNYPEVLKGAVTGRVAYSVDRDDPGTLEGEGRFEVKDGQFSADFLYSILERQMKDEVATLPTSLKFSRLATDVRFHKDIVDTPTLELVSEGIRLEGKGRYVRDGDMDYMLKIAVSPDMAEQIPILRDNFSIQGLRLAQQDIELGFRIGGPTFNPWGQLAELPPASVTLVSGALGVTSEAIKIIDFPRKILVELLKIGGGIVGATTR